MKRVDRRSLSEAPRSCGWWRRTILGRARARCASRCLAAGVSFTDAQLRAGTYLGVPKPPFTPGYELVGIVEELGPGLLRGCARETASAR